jgi:hypothetical protein
MSSTGGDSLIDGIDTTQLVGTTPLASGIVVNTDVLRSAAG